MQVSVLLEWRFVQWRLSETYFTLCSAARPVADKFGVGNKLTRGFALPPKKVESKDEKTAVEKSSDATEQKGEDIDETNAERPSLSETKRETLKRQMSSLLESGTLEDKEKQDEEVRKRGAFIRP